MKLRSHGGGKFATDTTTKSTQSSTSRRKRNKKRGRGWIRLAVVLVVLACMYLTGIYSNIGWIKTLRETYIQTAMSTMSHQWLATAFIPHSVIEEAMNRQDAAAERQVGVNSTDPPAVTLSAEDEEEYAGMTAEQKEFYTTFWELDIDSMEAYLAKHPDVLKNGYDNININESGLEDDGIDAYTTLGEQVLAIDAVNQVLLVRVSGKGYRGVLAVAKDPSLLSLESASTTGRGQYAGDIAEAHNGILAITGSSFADDGGSGNGGSASGFWMSNGESHGKPMGSYYKRLELRENNWLYIMDTTDPCDSTVTDAIEFTPALIVNGKNLIDESCDWLAKNPRACIGQTSRGEILMVVTEGRFLDCPGTGVDTLASIMLDHDCITGMNLDGGTSAILWYDGQYVTRCSNTKLPKGRTLPNAWIIARKDS